jgi:hypothetical protein
MKASHQTRTNLRSAIVQVRNVAKRKRVLSVREGRDKTVLMQEVRQLDEALRLLSWISK